MTRIVQLSAMLVSATILVSAPALVIGSPAQADHGAAQPASPAARTVELRTSDGVSLKASYFAADKAGPGMLLFHQANRTRKDWQALAIQLAHSGIHVLTVDMRGSGESGGNFEKRSATRASDCDLAWQFLVSQPNVTRGMIGLGGAGVDGVDAAVQTARRHPAEVHSLALLSGETFLDGELFLHEARQLPALFVASDDDEYPPIVEAMELMYVTASNPGKKFIHYVSAEEAPWLWYEPFDIGKVPPSGGHGTDLFKSHPELPGIITHWFVTTLIKTPGHAPADAIAASNILNQLRTPGGAAQVTQQLTEARRGDPTIQLFPEITASSLGQSHLGAKQPQRAVEILELVAFAYPDSADARETLSEAYLANGQKDLARQSAQKALSLLDTPGLPASSWTNTEPYRGEIRKGAQQVLQKLGSPQ